MNAIYTAIANNHKQANNSINDPKRISDYNVYAAGLHQAAGSRITHGTLLMGLLGLDDTLKRGLLSEEERRQFDTLQAVAWGRWCELIQASREEAILTNACRMAVPGQAETDDEEDEDEEREEE